MSEKAARLRLHTETVTTINPMILKIHLKGQPNIRGYFLWWKIYNENVTYNEIWI